MKTALRNMVATEFLEVDQRADLLTRDSQKILHRWWKSRAPVVCGSCGEAAKMILFHVKAGDTGKAQIGVRRAPGSSAAHREGCPHLLPLPPRRQKLNEPSHRISEPRRVRSGTMRAAHSPLIRTGVERQGWVQFCASTIARVHQKLSLVALDSSDPGRGVPRLLAFFEHTWELIDDGSDACPQAVALNMGNSYFLGVTDSTGTTPSLELPLAVYGAGLHLGGLGLPNEDWAPDFAAAPFGIPVPPPYFVLGVRRSGGAAHKLYLQPVALVRDMALPISSHEERIVAVALLDNPDVAGILRPTSTADLDIFLPKIGVPWADALIATGMCPDFLCCYRGGWRVIEWAGLTGVADYEERLEEKRGHYRGLFERYGVRASIWTPDCWRQAGGDTTVLFDLPVVGEG